MINNSSSSIRKYQFFEEVIADNQIGDEYISHEDSPLENTPITIHDIKPIL